MDTQTPPSPQPFAATAWQLHQGGWHPLPVPHGMKGPPPIGFTGYEGAVPSGADIAAWCDIRGGDSVAVRLPPEGIGLDVDAYDDKPGAASMDRLTLDLGPLPPTWRVSSRQDGISGIRLYRLPEPYAQLATDPDAPWRTGWPGVDVIRYGHRYLMAPPSVHPNGGTYVVDDEFTGETREMLPDFHSLPMLPEAWCAALLADDARTPARGRSQDSVYWTGGTPCRAVHAALGQSVAEMPAGRHDGALSALTRLTRLGEQGHEGVRRAVDTYRGAWLTAVTAAGEGQRTHTQATAEWARMVDGIDAIIERDPTPAHERRCCDTVTRDLPPWEPGDGERTGAERLADAYARDVAAELHRLRVRADAAERFRADNAPAVEPFDAGLLAEVLARTDTLTWRVEGLHPAGGSLLIVAQRKTGKTTTTLNYARSLLTGESFLAAMPVERIPGRVGLLNYEVSGPTLARWAADVGVPHDGLVLVNLRGRRNPLDHPEDRDALVEYLTTLDVSALIVDPFGRAYTGQSQNDPGEVGAWLASLDRFAADVGATETVLTTHAGWNGERTRGSSALEDWADAIATLTRDDAGQRYLRAIGRDVEVEEDRLEYDPGTRLLSLTGAGSRQVARATAHRDALAAAILDAVTTTPGLSVSDLTERLRQDGHGLQRGDVSNAARHLEGTGRIRREKAGRTMRHYPAGFAHTGNESRHVPTSPTGLVNESRPVPLGRDSLQDTFEAIGPEQRSAVECPHGTPGGAEPDPWLRGRLACPACAAELARGGAA